MTTDGSPAEQTWLDGLRTALTPPGPHTQHTWHGGKVGLGHCLMQNTPANELSRSPRPVSDGPLHVSFAGWLADAEALCRHLGHPADEPHEGLFRAAWSRWGEDCLRHIDGEFSVAIVDRREGTLHLAQSRVTSIPLYYVRTPRLFAFASRIVPLIRLPGVVKRLDVKGFARSLVLFPSDMDEGLTCFDGVAELPPAFCLQVRDDGGTSRRKYWHLPATVPMRVTRPADVYEALLHLLRRAVRQRIRDARTVLCYLSGGLDSSALACLAAETTRVVAVSCLGMADDARERSFVEAVARPLDIEVEYVHPREVPGPWQATDDEFARYESPLLYSAHHFLFRTLNLRARQQEAPVILNGVLGELGPTCDGSGVELLRMLCRGQWLMLMRQLVDHGRAQHTSLARVLWREVVRPAIQLCRRQTATDIPSSVDMLTADVARQVSLDGFRAPDISWHDVFGADEPIIGNRMKFLYHCHAARQAGCLECHRPFRDRRLFEYCSSLPRWMTRYEGRQRGLIRGAMRKILPVAIAQRTDKGQFTYYSNELRCTIDVGIRHCEAVEKDSLAHHLIDVPRLHRALTHAKSHTPPAAAMWFLQWNVLALQYLDWFEAI